MTKGKSSLDVLLILAALAAVVVAGWSLTSYFGSTFGGAADIALIKSRVIYSETVQGDSVYYGYRSDPLPDKLAPDEVVALRTPSSYTRELAVKNQGTKNEQTTMQLIAYSHPVFIEDAGEWYYLGYARVPESVFNKARASVSSALEHLMGATAYADTYSSTGGDGDVSNAGGSTWAATRLGTSGTKTATVGATPGYIIAGYNNSKASGFTIARAFFPFDTSSIPSGASIGSASLNIYVTYANDDDVNLGYNDGYDYLTVVATTTQADSTTLVVADYLKDGQVVGGLPVEGVDSANRPHINTISTNAYLSIPLNAVGIANVTKSGGSGTCGVTNGDASGVTCFGVREGHDTANQAIPASTASDEVDFSTSFAGAGQEPYLSVTYGGGPMGWWSDF